MKNELCIYGITVPISATDVSPIIWEALTSGSYEAKEARLVQRLLRKGDHVLELGAGMGIITTLMARMPGVTIWSYDANPHTIGLAVRVAQANGVENAIFNHGLVAAGQTGRQPFYIRRDFWMSSLIEEQGPYLEVLEIPSLDVDALVTAHDINVLVMDIEGAERQLLQAAVLHGVDRVFMELHDHLYSLAGVRDVFVTMLEKGFSYDPRNSSGACVVFSRNLDSVRTYNPDDDL